MNAKTFFVVGTAKAGTTTIYRFLEGQPQVQLSVPKETWYFDGPRYSSTNPRCDFLRHHMPNHRQAQIYGEVATSYLFAPHALQRVREAFPEAKIIAILRAPIERAFSDWWMLYSAGVEPLDFGAAVGENLARLGKGITFEGVGGRARWWSHLESLAVSRRVLYRTYVDYGHYDVQLRRLFSTFSSEQIRVLFFEDLFSPPDNYVQVFSKELGIDFRGARPTIKANPAFRSRLMRRLAGKVAQSRIRGFFPGPARAAIVRIASKFGGGPRIGDSVRAHLQEHFEPHIRELESVTGRDLSSWRAANI